MSRRHELFLSTAIGSLGLAGAWVPALAADLPITRAPIPTSNVVFDPAVSGVNFKAALYGGALNGDTGITSWGDGLVGGTAALTIPIGVSFGLQVDGMVGTWGGDAFYGFGGHGFWRNPSFGSLGIYAGYTYLDRGGWPNISVGAGLDVVEVAAEGELYFGNITLAGQLGWQGGDLPDRILGKAEIAFYATPDFKFAAGYRYSGGINMATLGAEWLTPVQLGTGRMSVFGEGRIGEADYRGAWAGLKFYFGKSKTLIDKHRKDDPTEPLPDTLFAIQSLVGSLDLQNKEAGSSSPP